MLSIDTSRIPSSVHVDIEKCVLRVRGHDGIVAVFARYDLFDFRCLEWLATHLTVQEMRSLVDELERAEARCLTPSRESLLRIKLAVETAAQMAGQLLQGESEKRCPAEAVTGHAC